MAKRRKVWMYSPPTPPKLKAPPALQVEVQAKANDLVENVLKPQFVVPPPHDVSWNYVVDIFTRWYRSYFYFCATYRCPAPNCLSEFFEVRFARLQYVGDAQFNLAYMRHTGQWWELYTELPLESCLLKIKNEPHFQP